MATIPTTSECKAWLKIAHTQDDAIIAQMISAAWDEYTTATGRVQNDLKDSEKVYLMERVGQFYGYRGDDAVSPSTWFTDALRRQFNPNSVG